MVEQWSSVKGDVNCFSMDGNRLDPTALRNHSPLAVPYRTALAELVLVTDLLGRVSRWEHTSGAPGTKHTAYRGHRRGIELRG